MIVQDLAQHPIRSGFLAIVDFRYLPASLRWGEALRGDAPGVVGLRCHGARTLLCSPPGVPVATVTPLLPWCEAPSTTRAVVTSCGVIASSRPTCARGGEAFRGVPPALNDGQASEFPVGLLPDTRSPGPRHRWSARGPVPAG